MGQDKERKDHLPITMTGKTNLTWGGGGNLLSLKIDLDGEKQRQN